MTQVARGAGWKYHVPVEFYDLHEDPEERNPHREDSELVRLSEALVERHRRGQLEKLSLQGFADEARTELAL